jgi:hypothetical protein
MECASRVLEGKGLGVKRPLKAKTLTTEETYEPKNR